MTKARMILVTATAAAALIGCEGKKDGGAAGSASASGAASASGSGVASVAVDARCENPCRFLADVALDKVGNAHQQACRKPWTTPDPTDCDQLDYRRNCIYATAGGTFKKPKWQDAFGKLPWYAARADFKESDLSRVASSNVRDLKQQALACRGKGEARAAIPTRFTASKITKADQATIVGWFAQKAKGEAVLPPKLESEGSPATGNEIMRWLAQGHLFQLKPWTPFEYDEGETAGAPRHATIATGAASPDCVGEDGECEGFEWITFELDAKGAIVGLSVGAAACPLVYVEHADGALSYEGEILRNLVQPAHEATQHLRLDALPTCSGEVRVQLVEAKDERTFLDDVALVLDGTAVAPRACREAESPAYCGDDGRFATLSRGQTLALVFDVPPGLACARPVLRADGYYVPVAP